MFLRLCGPPSIPLSFTVAGVLPRWNTYRFRLDSYSISQKSSIHRLLRGLPGYLILFDPHAFVLQCQTEPGTLPSQSAFCVISMHFTATPHIPHTSSPLQHISFNGKTTVELQLFTTDLIRHLRTL